MYPTYKQPSTRKRDATAAVRLPTYNRTGTAVAVSMPTDPRRAYNGVPRVVTSNTPPPVADERLTGDAGADLARNIPDAPDSHTQTEYETPSIIEGASPSRPNDDPVSLTATETPQPYQPLSPLEQSRVQLRNLVNQPLKNNALASGGMMAAEAVGQAAQSGSVGRTIGAGLGGFLGGLINKKAYARQKQAGEIQQQQQVVGMDEQAEKEQHAAAKEASDAEFRKAQIDESKARAEKDRRLPTIKPTYRKQGGVTYSIDPSDPSKATPVIGVNGEALAPDYQRPVFVDALGEDGVTMTRHQYNSETKQYEPVQANGQPVITKRVPRVNTDTGMTAAQEASGQQHTADRTARVADNAANRALRVRIANMPSKAKAGRSGAGFITMDGVVQKTNEAMKKFNLIQEDALKLVMGDAHRAGITIRD